MDGDQRLTIFILVLYCIVGFACLFQISRILYYRHLVKSFQFGFLSICLVWCILRSIFFMYGGNLTGYSLMLVYWLPVDLQFATFSLLVMFYAFLLYQYEWEERRRCAVFAYCIINAGVVITTLVYVLTSCDSHSCDLTESLNRTHHVYMSVQFLILVLVYGLIAYRLYKQDRVSGSAVLTFGAWLIFASRLVYNIMVSVDMEAFAMTISFEENESVSSYHTPSLSIIIVIVLVVLALLSIIVYCAILQHITFDLILFHGIFLFLFHFFLYSFAT